MLDVIQSSGMSTVRFIRKVEDKEDGVRFMSFGHRVYKDYDPRAAIVKETIHDILTRLGSDDGDHKFEIVMELEGTTLRDEYFVSRSLYPSVDLYIGFICQTMGLPTEMFMPLFALGRLPGWIAQYREMIVDPAKCTGRPRQVYDGSTERHYVAMHRRKHDDGQYLVIRAGASGLDRVTRV